LSRHLYQDLSKTDPLCLLFGKAAEGRAAPKGVPKANVKGYYLSAANTVPAELPTVTATKN
jgi:hypothetical protein